MNRPSGEIRQQLLDLKNLDITASANQLFQRSSKAQRQESAKLALVELYQSFEKNMLDVLQLRFDFYPAQVKKLRFKKDRIRILKQLGIDYTAIDGAETAQVLSLIQQSLLREDGIVTHDLHDVFPFWKEGFPMVQLDNAFETLSEDIQIHYEALIDSLLAV